MIGQQIKWIKLFEEPKIFPTEWKMFDHWNPLQCSSQRFHIFILTPQKFFLFWSPFFSDGPSQCDKKWQVLITPCHLLSHSLMGHLCCQQGQTSTGLSRIPRFNGRNLKMMGFLSARNLRTGNVSFQVPCSTSRVYHLIMIHLRDPKFETKSHFTQPAIHISSTRKWDSATRIHGPFFAKFPGSPKNHLESNCSKMLQFLTTRFFFRPAQRIWHRDDFQRAFRKDQKSVS